MANKIKYDDKQAQILVLLNDGVRQAEIARTLSISRQTLKQRINRYEKNGLLVRHNRDYKLTENGVNVISRRVPIPLTNTLTVSGEKETFRKHNIRVKVPLRERLENPQVFLGSKGVDFRRMGLKNVNAGSFNVDNFIVELMPRSAIVILPDVELPVSASVGELAACTWEHLRSILDKTELRLGLKFLRPAKDFFLAEVVSRHIAFTNHPFAKAVKGLVSGVWVIEYDLVDGKPRLIIDFSAAPELEAVHKKYAPEDAELVKQRVGGFLSEVKAGEFEHWRTDIQGLLSEYGEYLKAHIPFVVRGEAAFRSVCDAYEAEKLIRKRLELLLDSREGKYT